MIRYWVLSIDPELTTVDDMRLNQHGYNYDRGGYTPSVRKGDVAVIFDSKSVKFRKIGRFLTGVSVQSTKDTEGFRYDFLVDVNSRRETAGTLRTIKNSLQLPKHAIKGTRWLTRVLTRLTRLEFDDLMHAWWGVSDLSHELEGNVEGSNSANYAKYAAYTYAFERLREAIERGFYIESVAMAESIISDRLRSACLKVDKIPKRADLNTLIEAASRLVPPLPKSNDYQEWRRDRNQVMHGIVKSSLDSPLMRTSPFLDLAERTALSGERLARAAAKWSKKIK